MKKDIPSPDLKLIEDLISAHPKAYKSIFTFEFDPFEISKMVGRENEFVFVAYALLRENGLLKQVNVPIFMNFIT